MQLACPLDGAWSVRFGSSEKWTGPDGKTHEFVRGTCGRCGTEVLVNPSTRAVELAAARLSAAGTMRKMSGG